MRRPNSTGTVYKLSGKRRKPFTAVVTVGLVEGKYKRKTLGYFPTQKEALAALSEYNHDPYDIDSREITLEEMFDKWKAYREGRGKPIAGFYLSSFKYCAAFHRRRFVDIETIHIQEMVDNAPSPFIAIRIKQVFNMLYKYAILTGVCRISQTVAIELPKIPKSTKHKPFTEEEIAELWKNKDEPSARLALVYCYTGLRPSELLNLKRENVHIDKRYMIGGSKTEAGINRTIPIAEKILPFIRQWYETGGDYLAPVEPRSLNKLGRIFQNSPIPCIREHLPHDGRHTCETMLDNARVAKRTIQLIIGHAGKDVDEKVYTHKTREQLIAAINQI